MNPDYQHQQIEKQAQQYWQQNRCFCATEDNTKPKFYCLSMFPYPSGRLHMGHVRNYSIGDVIARYQRMQGRNVLQPIGWDGFGLPAENAALKNKVAPAKWTNDNIQTMKKQLSALGFAYDWSREIATSDPEYYRWEQLLFTKLFEKGLVYKKNAMLNWDPVDKTVLANEQVVDGRGWRSGALIEQKEIGQWFMRITDYADELLAGLEDLDGWPKAVKTMQKNWIGRSSGLEIDFKIADFEALKIYTTRADTLMGATFVAIAAEHPLALKVAKTNSEVKAFVKKCKTKIAEASFEVQEKLGIDSGLKCTHPISGKQLPIWVANFVLTTYGSGAVMCVPGHDERDFEFANKYQIPILRVIKSGDDEPDKNTANTEKGVLFNSGEFDGLKSDAAIKQIAKLLEKNQAGRQKINYRLHDWGVSRQRYWGCPIPIINCEKCGAVAVSEQDLPVVLPTDVTLSSAQSPLKNMPEFYQTSCPKCKGEATRETDTFDTFFESSWYFARFASFDNQDKMLDERADYWLAGGIEQYIGGVEHAILHLLYARFFNKLLRDEGLIKNSEPFKNLLTQGMVLKDGSKMSKSRGNTVDPEAMIAEYGADAVRLFILFAAPPAQDLEWADSGIEGANRFIKRVYATVFNFIQDTKTIAPIADTNTDDLNDAQKTLRRQAHQALQKISDDLDRRHSFNTAIAAMMTLTNTLSKFVDTAPKSMIVRAEAINILVKTLSPIAPHLTHYLWQKLGNTKAVIDEAWDVVDADALSQNEVQIVVQVNGKLRAKLTVAPNSDPKTLETLALQTPNVTKFTTQKTIKKVVIVPNKLINIVAV